MISSFKVSSEVFFLNFIFGLRDTTNQFLSFKSVSIGLSFFFNFFFFLISFKISEVQGQIQLILIVTKEEWLKHNSSLRRNLFIFLSGVWSLTELPVPTETALRWSKFFSSSKLLFVHPTTSRAKKIWTRDLCIVWSSSEQSYGAGAAILKELPVAREWSSVTVRVSLVGNPRGFFPSSALIWLFVLLKVVLLIKLMSAFCISSYRHTVPSPLVHSKKFT